MSCTFFWSFENNSTTLDSGGVDYSAGDTTATETGTATTQSTQAFKGTYGGGYDTGADEHIFDAASIFDETDAGSFGFMIYINSAMSAGNPLFMIRDSGGSLNRVTFESYGSYSTSAGGILMRARSATGSNVTTNTGDIGLTENTWYGVVGRIDAVAEEMELEVYNSTGTSLYSSPSPVSITNTIADWTVIGTLQIRYGNYSGTSPYGLYTDNCVFGSAYADAVEDWLYYNDYGDFSPGGTTLQSSLMLMGVGI